jgi:NAD(P)-dependent dehydrogenase (short-subunit alcohol dehydrogenase family)
MEIQLSGKRILITGGTGALGRAFVARALEEGACVFFTYHKNQKEAEELIKQGAKGFPVDLSKRSEIDVLQKEIGGATRGLDSLIHNAAIVRDHTIQNLTEADWDEVISINLSAVYYLTKQFLPFLAAHAVIANLPVQRTGVVKQSQGEGLLYSAVSGRRPRNDIQPKILTVISRVGLRGGFGQANYAAAKGGLIALTKSLALELGEKHILVNGINPGFMRSQLNEAMPEEVINRNIEESALQTISNPQTVADFMVYLLSDRFRDVTGQIFHLDSRPV